MVPFLSSGFLLVLAKGSHLQIRGCKETGWVLTSLSLRLSAPSTLPSSLPAGLWCAHSCVSLWPWLLLGGPAHSFSSCKVPVTVPCFALHLRSGESSPLLLVSECFNSPNSVQTSQIVPLKPALNLTFPMCLLCPGGALADGLV